MILKTSASSKCMLEKQVLRPHPTSTETQTLGSGKQSVLQEAYEVLEAYEF